MLFCAGWFRWVCTVSLLAILPLYSGTPASAQLGFEVVYQLPTPGSHPSGRLLTSADGTIYGMAQSGGIAGLGTLFKYSPDGVFSKILDFTGANGAHPTGFWTVGNDFNYYGTTAFGGKNDAGTLFRLTPQGEFNTVADFPRDIGSLNGAMVQTGDGSFYGTTKHNGVLVWKVSPSGIVTTIAGLSQFEANTPESGLTPGPRGRAFYGTSRWGGANSGGTFFEVTPLGQLTMRAAFGNFGGGTEYGAEPTGPLLLGTDGNFYGTTRSGGRHSLGTVFRITPEGTITTLAHFDGSNGAKPSGGLVAPPGGGTVLHGTTREGGANGDGTIFSIDTAAPAPEITVHASFEGEVTGNAPESTLAYDAAGLLIGTTQLGGENNGGVLFRFSNSLEALFHFGDRDGSDLNGLTRGPAGSLYGTSRNGGARDQGTFFHISSEGDFSKLTDFGVADAAHHPSTQLVLGEGVFYGLTQYGGADDTGVLFEVTMAGELISRASIPEGRDYMDARDLMKAADGSLYINTLKSGSPLESPGTIFRYVPGGTLTPFFEFSYEDPGPPRARLTQGSDGMLYGGDSSFFRLTPEGSLTLLADLNSWFGSSLLLRADGNFYGVARGGGKYGMGTVHKTSTTGKVTTLANFNGLTGAAPDAALLEGPGGALFGTTSRGGANQLGTVFRITPAGKITVLADLSVSSGVLPKGTLVVGPDGNLWGTTRTTIFRIITNNHPPTATADALELPAYDVKITANDSDPDGDVLTITSVGPAEHGTVQLNEDNTITYLPGATFTGTDSFAYTISDGLNGTATATVTVAAPTDLKRASAGAYSGFLSQDGIPLGFVSARANGKGSLTASITSGSQKLTFKAPIDQNGNVRITVPAKKLFPEMEVSLRIDPATNSLTGTVTIQGEVLQVELSRTFPAFSKKAPTPLAGKYTVLLRLPPEAVGSTSAPQGTGYATALVSPTGLITVVGKLTDGTPFSTGSILSRQGRFPFYAAPYKKKMGSLAGSVGFADEAGSDFSGGVLWQRPGPPTNLDPFGSPVTLLLRGARYTAPIPKATVAPFNPGEELALRFSESPILKTLSISATNKLTVLNPGDDKTQMKLKTATGVFNGTFVAPGETKKSTFGGVIYQKGPQPAGEGFYRHAERSNQVILDSAQP